jgi:hypothetical protein
LTIEGLTLPKGTQVTLLGSTRKAALVNSGKAVRIVPPSVSPADFNGSYAYVFKIAGGARSLK